MRETLPMSCETLTNTVAESLEIEPESRCVGVFGSGNQMLGSRNSFAHNGPALPGNGNYKASKAASRHSEPVEFGRELASFAISYAEQEAGEELTNLEKYSLVAEVCEKFVWKIMISENYATLLYAEETRRSAGIVNPKDEAETLGVSEDMVIETWESNNIDAKIVDSKTGEVEKIQVKTDVSRIKKAHKEDVHTVLEVETNGREIEVVEVHDGELEE